MLKLVKAANQARNKVVTTFDNALETVFDLTPGDIRKYEKVTVD